MGECLQGRVDIASITEIFETHYTRKLFFLSLCSVEATGSAWVVLSLSCELLCLFVIAEGNNCIGVVLVEINLG